MKPLVSVVVPSVRCRWKLQHRLWDNVIKSQSYKNLELLIIVDDKLTAPEARNKGWLKAKGKYIAFLDDDDEWHPDKIVKQVAYMEENPNCSLCITGSLDYRFNQTRICMPKEYPTHRDVIKSFNLSSTSSYMIRNDGGFIQFNESLPASQEYDLAIQLSNTGHIHCIQEILVFQNATKGQISTNMRKKVRGVVGLYKLYKNEYTIIDKIKTVGLICMFISGLILKTKIYRILNKFKEIYEDERNG